MTFASWRLSIDNSYLKAHNRISDGIHHPQTNSVISVSRDQKAKVVIINNISRCTLWQQDAPAFLANTT